MPRPIRSQLVVARVPFFRGRLAVVPGEVFRSDDPLVLGYPSAFVPLVIRASGIPAPIRERGPEPGEPEGA